MLETVIIGPDGEVLIPIMGPGFFAKGKIRKIVITNFSFKLSLPFSVQEALRGMEVKIAFTGEQINPRLLKYLGLESDVVIVYIQEVIRTLKAAGKGDAAQDLMDISCDKLDMFAIFPESFCFVS